MLTEHTQPAILTMSVAAARVLARHGIEPDLVAGHSLGEHPRMSSPACSTSQTPSRPFGDEVVTWEAVPLGKGAMAAILGLDAEGVRRACDEAADGEVVSPANINSPDQVVIAGAAGAVRRASDRAKALGAKRAVPLSVSAPFHCALMKPAEERLAPELRALAVRDQRVPIDANVDGRR